MNDPFSRGTLPVGLANEELERVRADTPGLIDTLHFDNAGASPMPEPAFRAMVAVLERERMIGGYAAQREARQLEEGLYEVVAELIGARSHQIAYAESATRAWDMAFYGVRFRPGDRILTGRAEYTSNYLSFLQVAERFDVEIDVIPDDANGTLDLDQLAARLDDRVRVVNICHAPTSNGLVNPAEAVGAMLKGHPALYFLDACQSAGQRPLDVKVVGCDVLSATGRKFLRGPRGTGFLFVSDRALDELDPPFIDMRSAQLLDRHDYRWRGDARRFEAWESATAGRVGLAAAIRYALDLGIDRIASRIDWLATLLRERLAEQPLVAVRDRGADRSGIVTLAVPGVDVEVLRDRLAARGAATTALVPSDAPLDLRGDAVLRASVHCFNTRQEVDRFIQLLVASIGELRCGG